MPFLTRFAFFTYKIIKNIWFFNVDAVKALTGKNQQNEEEKNYIPANLVLLLIFFEFLTFLTKYFPFSEFFKDRKFHYKNRFLAYLDRSLIGASIKTGGKYEIIDLEENEYFVMFAIFLMKPKQKKKQNEKFLKYLKKKFGQYLYLEGIDVDDNTAERVKIIKLRKTFFDEYSYEPL